MNFEHFGMVTVKKMFGAADLYYGGIIFAIIADDVLYFKVDDSNRYDYEKAEMCPFKPFKDKSMIMSYYEVPPEVIEDKEDLVAWALKAAIVSRSSPGKKMKKNNKLYCCREGTVHKKTSCISSIKKRNW